MKSKEVCINSSTRLGNKLRCGDTKVTYEYLTFKEESPTCITRRA